MQIDEEVKLLPLPNSLKNWTELHLIESFKLTKRPDLREMIAFELIKRIENNNK